VIHLTVEERIPDPCSKSSKTSTCKKITFIMLKADTCSVCVVHFVGTTVGLYND